jgi:hypothetical protein
LTSLAACGADEEKKSNPADDRRQIRATLQTFADSAGRRDYPTICRRVLSRSLVQRVTVRGVPCEVALREGLGQVRDPRIQVRRIRLDGTTALALVRTTASNQPPSTDVVQLVKEDGGWKISRLARPQPPTPDPGGETGTD